MNTQQGTTGIDDARWQAQERARLAAQAGMPAGDDADLRIAAALRRAPAVALPPEFAARVAAMARAEQATTSLLERRLLRGLGLTLALSSAVTVAYYGHGWVAALVATLPGGNEAVAWSAAAAACLVGNWAWGVLRDRLQAGPVALA